MCLQSIDKVLVCQKRQRVGYKVMFKNGPGSYSPIYQGGGRSYRRRVVHTAVTPMIEAGSWKGPVGFEDFIRSGLYRAGFHAYKKLSDARRYVKTNLLGYDDRKLVILKVWLWGDITIGKQPSGETIVGEFMYIQKQVKGDKNA